MIKKVQVWILYQDEVLLLKVIKERGSGWHPVTATVEKNENRLDCAKREILEETGISEKMGDLVPLDFSFEYNGRWGKAEEVAFVMRLRKKPGKIKIDPSEHTEFKWVKITKAPDLLEHESQRIALEKLECLHSKI